MKSFVRVTVFLILIITIAFLLTEASGSPPARPSINQYTTISETIEIKTPTQINSPTILPSFSFASMGDAQADATNFNATVDQIEDLYPDFVIFNGDLENDGVASAQMDPMIGLLTKAGLLDQTFLVRGNHDNHMEGSAALWETFFESFSDIKPLPKGVTDYTSLDPASYYLTYSFDYRNSIFIGLDDPGNVNLLTTAELQFLDARLTDAENEGLTHAFIFSHGPLYCVESVHCGCSARTDASCTKKSLISIINKHPIVSATFHGHEHILGWTHMDNARVAGLTGSFEQFITSPSGGWTYNDYLYPDRVDYYVPNMDSEQGFGYITVNGSSFTMSIYKTNAARPVWSKSFTK